MTPILIGACDCASPAVVTIAVATRATRTIHRVAIGRLLRDGEGWQGEYPRPPIAQARRFADGGLRGHLLCRDSRRKARPRPCECRSRNGGTVWRCVFRSRLRKKQ